MSLVTRNVLIRLRAANGTALAGAAVRAVLTKPETDGGLVVPSVQAGTTDGNGELVMALWPNERGTAGSQYRVYSRSLGASFDCLIAVPDLSSPSPLPIETLIAEPYPAVDNSLQALQGAQKARLQADADVVETEANKNASATSADNAANSEVTTTAQAEVATTQAGIATTQAGVATTQAGIATSGATKSVNWAQQTGGDVTGEAAGSRSAKAWAQDPLTGTALGGSAKDWAQSSTFPDGVSKSAKTYAQDAAGSATAAAGSVASVAAIVTGVASGQPKTKPSLLLDFANSKALDSRIIFTRASTQTYYDGVTVAKAEENLLVYSQEFNNSAWTKTDVTVTAAATTAPDGTNTAGAVFETATNSNHRIQSQIITVKASGVYTFSVYVKGIGRSHCALYHSSGRGKFFHIPVGGGGSVLGDFPAAPTSATIMHVGNDWYRVSITDTIAASSSFRLYTSDTGTSDVYIGDPVKGLYAWGAQLEMRSAITEYVPTTSTVVSNVLPRLLLAASGVPCFQHDPITGECTGLLVEGPATNFLVRSSDFGNSSWNNASPDIPNVETDRIVAPDGTVTADKLTAATGGTSSAVRQHCSTATTGDFSGSVYVKAGTSNRTRIQLIDGTSGYTVVADASISWSAGVAAVYSLALGQISLKSVGGGWYRLGISAYTASTAAQMKLALFPDSVSGVGSIYAWGAQIEAGSVPTSYIGTTSAQVTRDATNAKVSIGSAWYNYLEGTLYAEFTPSVHNDTGQHWVLALGLYNSDGSGLSFDGSGYMRAGVSNAGDILTANAVTKGAKNRGVAKYSKATHISSSSYMALNGAQVAGPGTNFQNASVAFSLAIGQRNSNQRYLQGTVGKIAYFPASLSDAELQILTSA